MLKVNSATVWCQAELLDRLQAVQAVADARRLRLALGTNTPILTKFHCSFCGGGWWEPAIRLELDRQSVHFWEQGLLELEGPGNEPDAEKEPGFDLRVRQHPAAELEDLERRSP